MTTPSETSPIDDLLDDEPETLTSPESDDEWLLAPQHRRRVSTLTTALVAGIVIALAFTGGVLVQKHHDQGATSSSLRAGLSGGFPVGLSAVGSLPGGNSSTGATSSGTNGANVSAPAVIGTVVSVHGRVLTVRNLGGKTVRVTVPVDVKVTQQTSHDLASLAHGRSVAVEGTTDADGTVTASTITSR